MLAIGIGISQFGDQGPPPLKPMPKGVPNHPTYPDADAILARLGKKGMPCTVLNDPTSGDSSVGEFVICEAKLDGLRFQNHVHTYNPDKVSRAEVGDIIATEVQPPYNNTIVAAGNWFVRVRGDQPFFAHYVAEALGGAVLRPGPPSPTASFP